MNKFRSILVAVTSACVCLTAFASDVKPREVEAPAAETPKSGGSPKVPVETLAEPMKVPGVSNANVDAFTDIARVLLSPRCVNCHPDGNAPYQGDNKAPHKMKITRDIEKVGLSCSTCHRKTTVPGIGRPPGVVHWQLPSAETPLIFEGRTHAQLCEQLKDPKTNGNKTLAQLLTHVEKDALVLYGFNPGAGRTKPPLTHEAFVAKFKTWIDLGAPCR